MTIQFHNYLHQGLKWTPDWLLSIAVVTGERPATTAGNLTFCFSSENPRMYTLR